MKIVSKLSYYDLLTITTLRESVNITLNMTLNSIDRYILFKKKFHYKSIDG